MSGSMYFPSPQGFETNADKIVNGVRMAPIACCWFTNITHSKRNQPMNLYMKYREDLFPKYDNYDAINVDKTCEIPMDYNGVMGVPISFLDKYCPEQFQIIGITENSGRNKILYIPNCEKYDRPYINGKRMYSRLLIKKIS